MPRESAELTADPDELTADPDELTANPAIAGTEQILAEVLADLVQVERVPANSHFFRDLGADSLVMAHFCARIRKRADVPSVSMQDIYRHPTLRSLATSLAETAVGPATPTAPATPAEVAATVRTREYVLCGALQALFFLGYAWVAALVGARAYDWISTASGLGEIYLRSVLFGGAGFLVVCLLPIGAKWMLIGRWKPRLVAFYAGPRPLQAEFLRDRLAESLPGYMVPSAFWWRESMPLTANSKIDAKALKALAATFASTGPDDRPADDHAPGTATEQRLAAAWAKVLGIPADQIGRRDNFFDRGGTSLSAVKLAITLDRAVSLRELNTYPVLADLARLVDGRQGG